MTGTSRRLTRKPIPRVAVIGCGAAAREFCLPVLAKFPDFRQSIVLVDKTASQAEVVAKEYGIQNHCTDFQTLPFDVEAAMVMTPHHLHAEQSIHFLRQGIPVFVEKPMGMSGGEVTRMLNAAQSSGTTLMVNNCRRLFPSYRRIQELLASGELGPIRSVTISDGSPFEWNSVSAFYLRNARQAKGVFLDRGAHTVDIVCWWLSGRPQVTEARFDAMGGAEALMKIKMKLESTSIQLAFSRCFKLENTYTIECEHAQITGRLFHSTKFEISRNGQVESIDAGKSAMYNEYPWQLIENFVQVVQDVAPPLFTAGDVAPSIELIDESYQQAKPFVMPWYDDDPNLALLKSQAMSQNPRSEHVPDLS